MRFARVGLALMVLIAVLVTVSQIPVDVPDTNSPLEGNHTGEVNAANTIGQTLVASRNGLDRIELTVSAEKPISNAEIKFRIQEVPWKQSREVTRLVGSLPIGKASDFGPGTITQRWYSFEFDPIADSAGKQYYFTLEGKTLERPNSVGMLMFFHNGYPLGEAYINGNPVGGHVVFRSYTKGRVSDLIAVLAANATANMPGLAGAPFFYAAVGFLYAALGTASAIAIRKTS